MDKIQRFLQRIEHGRVIRKLLDTIKTYPRFFSLVVFLFLCASLFWTSLPKTLFRQDYSLVLLDREGELLGAKIADDEQWRFPPRPAVPEKFLYAITCYEDKRFLQHPGVDPFALVRAVKQNIEAKKVVSGGSTITMQVVRLFRQKHKRTVWEKLIEMALALRLELSYSKKDILALFASHAPFGGNVVGLDAAAWRYFGRSPESLSWAEHALLAVLPNSPALIHPGKNREVLKQKRDSLLEKMHERGIIDELTCALSKQERVPAEPLPLPMLAPHLLFHVEQSNRSKETREHARSCIRTTLDRTIQSQAKDILERQHLSLAGNGIHNAAALIVEVESGKVLAYIGNVGNFIGGEHENQVDIIQAPRSTGSILKPFLYAAMIHSGEILPTQLVPDIPTRMGGFMPENFSRTYEGAVPAYRALARSLNVPVVKMLQSFGVDRFCAYLKQLGMSTLHRPAYKYGLSLILGGAEANLWELTGIYASIARSVQQYPESSEHKRNIFFPPYYREENSQTDRGNDSLFADKPLDPGACWLTLQAMVEAERPGHENPWRDFESAQKIAWKTGTSYGFRDAWAIGVNPRYAIGVWVGNANGEGRPGLIGSLAAAPILFELFGILESGFWFIRPDPELKSVRVCAQSGYRAGQYCEETEETLTAETGFASAPCPFCRGVHLDSDLRWQVNSTCEWVANIRTKNWFVLPPAMEWYYRKSHSDYKPLPQYRADCLFHAEGLRIRSLSIIYPQPNSRIYIPLELDGSQGRTVFHAAHRDPETQIYWHLDEEYIGTTLGIHQMSLLPGPGSHVLTLIDEHGERLQRRFTILSKTDSKG